MKARASVALALAARSGPTGVAKARAPVALVLAARLGPTGVLSRLDPGQERFARRWDDSRSRETGAQLASRLAQLTGVSVFETWRPRASLARSWESLASNWERLDCCWENLASTGEKLVDSLESLVRSRAARRWESSANS
jgi:hypothetical protein